MASGGTAVSARGARSGRWDRRPEGRHRMASGGTAVSARGARSGRWDRRPEGRHERSMDPAGTPRWSTGLPQPGQTHGTPNERSMDPAGTPRWSTGLPQPGQTHGTPNERSMDPAPRTMPSAGLAARANPALFNFTCERQPRRGRCPRRASLLEPIRRFSISPASGSRAADDAQAWALDRSWLVLVGRCGRVSGLVSA